MLTCFKLIQYIFSDQNDLNLCATTASDFEFPSNQLQYDFNSNGTLTPETTDKKFNENLDTNFFQEFISMHSNDFSELSKQQKEFLEEKYIETYGYGQYMETDIFPVAEPTYTVSLKSEYTLS